MASRASLSMHALLLALGLGACVGSARPKPGTLRVQLATEPVSLDPTLAEDGASIRVLANAWSGLDQLARKIDVSSDGLRLVVTLLESARWSDGVPVTAEHFVTGLR